MSRLRVERSGFTHTLNTLHAYRIEVASPISVRLFLLIFAPQSDVIARRLHHHRTPMLGFLIDFRPCTFLPFCPTRHLRLHLQVDKPQAVCPVTVYDSLFLGVKYEPKAVHMYFGPS